MSVGSNPGSFNTVDEKIGVAVSGWINDFDAANVHNRSAGGLLRGDLEQFSGMHTLGLIRLVDQCLQYRPEARPSLQAMKATIDVNLTRLDRLYGNEIKKPAENIAAGHQLHYSKDVESLKRFAIGQEYVSPNKRRRVDLSDVHETEYRALIDDWKDVARYPRPDAASQKGLIDAINDLYQHSTNAAIASINEDESLRYAYEYMLSCLRNRLDENGEFSYHRTLDDEDLQISFEHGIKRELLRHMQEHFVPLLRDGNPPIGVLNAITAFTHALGWALFISERRGEPMRPQLVDKTQVHRALRDWVLIHP
jgi:hypothetical protein